MVVLLVKNIFYLSNSQVYGILRRVIHSVWTRLNFKLLRTSIWPKDQSKAFLFSLQCRYAIFYERFSASFELKNWLATSTLFSFAVIFQKTVSKKQCQRPDLNYRLRYDARIKLLCQHDFWQYSNGGGPLGKSFQIFDFNYRQHLESKLGHAFQGKMISTL